MQSSVSSAGALRGMRASGAQRVRHDVLLRVRDAAQRRMYAAVTPRCRSEAMRYALARETRTRAALRDERS